MALALRDFLYEKRKMRLEDHLVDAVIAAGAFGFGILQLTVTVGLLIPDDFMRRVLGIYSVTPSLLSIALCALMCLPIAFRRRFPWPAYILSTLVWICAEALTGVFALVPACVLVALFTVAYQRGGIEAIVSGAICLGAVAFASFYVGSQMLNSLLLLQNISFSIAVCLAGYAMHARMGYVAEAQARIQLAERERDAEAAARVEAERVRIAREVHDITAHSLSAVGIQAAVAERLMGSDPEAAKDAIIEVRNTSKSALADLRSMIGVLRQGGADAQTAPVSGTERMGDLVSYLEGAGVECSLDMSAYHRDQVPSHVDVALYGIAREACTNIVRHANATSATLALTAPAMDGDARVACLDVKDDGSGIQQGAFDPNGNGLQGMRERVFVLGGTIEMANAPDGGFMVSAKIPMGKARP